MILLELTVLLADSPLLIVRALQLVAAALV